MSPVVTYPGTPDQEIRPVSNWSGGSDAMAAPSVRETALRYWRAAARHRFLIAAVLVVSVAAGVIYTLMQPSLYTAASRIELSKQDKNVTNVAGVDREPAYADQSFFETQYTLMRGPSLAERVARKLKLAEKPDFFASRGVQLDASSKLGATARRDRETLAAGLLLGGINVAPIEGSSLVDISYTSRSPTWSAAIANAWPQAFIDANMEREYTSNSDARRFLEGMLQNVRGKLEKSERDVLSFAADQNMVRLGGGRDAQGRSEEPRTLVETDLEALNTALNNARAERISAQSKVGSKAASESDGGIAALRAKRDELASDYAQLLFRFEPQHPQARSLKVRLDALDAAIAREGRRSTVSQQSLYQEAVNREAALQAQVQALKAKLDKQQYNNIQYSIYQREADTNRQLYDALLQRYKEVGIAGSVGSSNIAVVEQAKVPGGPSSPNMQRNVGLALLLGLILAALIVFALEQIDEKIRSPQDVAAMLGLPLLGSIPRVDGEPTEELGTASSELAEAYFSIRTVLAFATSHGLPRSIVVTSSQEGEGKSTSALALAMAIGRTGRSVLLIDADMRSPSAHHLVGGLNDKGFSNLLAGDNDFQVLIQSAAIGSVSVLPAGPPPPSAAELLGADRLKEVLELLQCNFDHVIIDAPPVLGLADAPLLARAVEGSVFVVEAERTGATLARNAVNRLRAVNSHVFGIVITKVDERQYGYGYSYSYAKRDRTSPKAPAAA